MKEKLLNMKKSPELKEFLLREPSLIIMPLKLKLNTFQRKSKKQLLNMNLLRESGKEFNIFQSKLKSFTTQKETTTLPDKENTSKLATSKEDMFHHKVELEPKQSTKLDTFQTHHQLLLVHLSDKEFKEPLNT